MRATWLPPPATSPFVVVPGRPRGALLGDGAHPRLRRGVKVTDLGRAGGLRPGAGGPEPHRGRLPAALRRRDLPRRPASREHPGPPRQPDRAPRLRPGGAHRTPHAGGARHPARRGRPARPGDRGPGALPHRHARRAHPHLLAARRHLRDPRPLPGPQARPDPLLDAAHRHARPGGAPQDQGPSRVRAPLQVVGDHRGGHPRAVPGAGRDGDGAAVREGDALLALPAGGRVRAPS